MLARSIDGQSSNEDEGDKRLSEVATLSGMEHPLSKVINDNAT